MNPWLIVSILGIAGLIGIICILHVYCDKLQDNLEGIILLMKYVLKKEGLKDDDNDIFRDEDN